MPWLPRVGYTTLRNATVSAVNAGRADVSIDGGTATGLPIYGGTPAVGDKVLVAVQGDSMVVLGKVGQTVADMQWNGQWFRDYIEGNYHRVKLIKTGRQVTIQGLGFMHNAATFPAGGVAASVPEGFEPDQNVIIRCLSHEGPGHVRFNIQTNGQLISEAPVSNATYMQFNHVYLAAS